jgi:hypothetical protein
MITITKAHSGYTTSLQTARYPSSLYILMRLLDNLSMFFLLASILEVYPVEEDHLA